MRCLALFAFAFALSSCFVPSPHDWCWSLGFGHCVSAAELALPDRRLTPGVADSRLTKEMICAKGFTTKTYRHTTAATKRMVCQAYHVTQCPGPQWEIDHLIPLEDGGADAIPNLWPQPIDQARVKDQLETQLHNMICEQRISLVAAQACLTVNWHDCWEKYEYGH